MVGARHRAVNNHCYPFSMNWYYDVLLQPHLTLACQHYHAVYVHSLPDSSVVHVQHVWCDDRYLQQTICVKQGRGTYLLSRVTKPINFILKFYLRVTSLNVLSKYLLIMELRFDAMLYSNTGNENSDAGQIKCSHGPHLARGPQVPHPMCKTTKQQQSVGNEDLSILCQAVWTLCNQSINTVRIKYTLRSNKPLKQNAPHTSFVWRRHLLKFTLKSHLCSSLQETPLPGDDDRYVNITLAPDVLSSMLKLNSEKLAPETSSPTFGRCVFESGSMPMFFTFVVVDWLLLNSTEWYWQKSGSHETFKVFAQTTDAVLVSCFPEYASHSCDSSDNPVLTSVARDVTIGGSPCSSDDEAVSLLRDSSPLSGWTVHMVDRCFGFFFSWQRCMLPCIFYLDSMRQFSRATTIVVASVALNDLMPVSGSLLWPPAGRVASSKWFDALLLRRIPLLAAKIPLQPGLSSSCSVEAGPEWNLLPGDRRD